MFGKNYKKKYLRYTDSVNADNNKESQKSKGNIDLIINKLERKLNTGNIHSGNADVILKMSSQNQDTTRTTKNNDSIINNISNLLEKNNIQEKFNELSQEFASSIVSVNSLNKGIKKSPKQNLDIDINLNNNLKNELELQENNTTDNKVNLVLSTNNSNTNINNTNNINNPILTRNKLINITESNSSHNNSNNNNISTISSHIDNSKYFLSKKANGLISSNKVKLKNNKNNENPNNNDINLKLSICNEKDRKKKIKMEEKNIKLINEKNKIAKGNENKIVNEWKRKCPRCNTITLIKNFLISIIILSCIAFFVIIFTLE